MKADIKAVHTVYSDDIKKFNNFVTTVVNDLQLDGLEVEIQYSFGTGEYSKLYTAMIIGRGK